jgi:hypothetical protein
MSDQQIKKQQMDKNINDGNYDMYFMHFMLQTIITNQNTMKDDLQSQILQSNTHNKTNNEEIKKYVLDVKNKMKNSQIVFDNQLNGIKSELSHVKKEIVSLKN